MSYRPRLQPAVLRQMEGLPDGALGTLVRVLARVCDDPYERLHSAPLRNRPDRRMAELGDFGFIEFEVDEDAGLIRVYRLVWTG